MKLDVVLPIYNEVRALGPFLDQLTAELERLGHDWRVHLVVDRSTDGTEALVAERCRSEPRLRALLLSARFGHQESLLAGLAAARVDASVLMMDADGQHPPAVIERLVAALGDDVDVVLTRRVTNRTQPLVSRWLSNAFYAVMSHASGVPLEAGMADFRLLSPRVAAVLRDAVPEQAPFLRGLLTWLGFSQAIVEYHAEARLEGRTKYSLRRRLRMARLAILAFSVGPLRLAAPLGILCALAAILYAGYLALDWLLGTQSLPPGWTTIVVLVAFLGGVQLAFIGVLGEYLANIYAEVKRRPRFVVRRAINYEDGSVRRFG
jgi:glycosyltransferase involved in cell wall biosynthesis